ncbi:MAG: nitroreductase family protein [Methanosarcinales archaeon Met12]|nr:MAG: nitroreductase family protein [Methanosarcinales archaeon Met12]
MNECFNIIETRRSIRRFKKKKVNLSDIKTLLRAAHMAPSAGNLQAREFIIVTNEDGRRGLSEAIYSQRHVAEVPAMVIVCANMLRSERRYGARAALYAIQDATASVMNILLAAHSLGLGTCWIGAFDEREVSSVLSIPAHVRPIALVAIGHPDEMPDTPPRLGERIEHWEGW